MVRLVQVIFFVFAGVAFADPPGSGNLGALSGATNNWELSSDGGLNRLAASNPGAVYPMSSPAEPSNRSGHGLWNYVKNSPDFELTSYSPVGGDYTPVSGILTQQGKEIFARLGLMANGTLPSLFSDPKSPGKLSGLGQEKRDVFCSFIKLEIFKGREGVQGLRSLPRNNSAFRFLAKAENLYGSESELKVAFRLNAMSKDIMDKMCEWGTNQGCLDRIKGNMDRFQKTCEETFETYMAPPHYDLQSNFEIAAQNARGHSGNNEDFLVKNINDTCSGGKNCYFLKDRSGEGRCNPFQCSMADQDSIPMENFEFANAFLMGMPGFDLSASKSSLCEACFKKQFKVHTGKSGRDFAAQKRKEREKLEDVLAANLAGKELLHFASGLETLLDMKSLYPYTFESSNISETCSEKMEQTLARLKSERCGGRFGNDKIDYRLSKAFAALGLPENSQVGGGELVAGVYNKINPEQSPRGCSREEFTKTAFIQWELNLQNDSYVKSYQDVADHSFESGFLDTVCSNDSEFPEQSYAAEFSEKLANDHWREIEGAVMGAISQGAGPKEISKLICPREGGGEATAVVCGKSSDGRESSFQSIQEREAENLERSLAQGPSGIEQIKSLVMGGTKARVKASVDVAMKMKPSLRMVLGDWGTLCEAKEKYEKEAALSKIGIGPGGGSYQGLIGLGLGSNFGSELSFGDFTGEYAESYETLEKMGETFRENLCEKTARAFSRSICSDELDLPGEGGKSRFSMDDLEKAKKVIVKDQNKLASDGVLASALAFNSLSCELKTVKEKSPELFSEESDTLFEVGDMSSSLEELLAIDERRNGIGGQEAKVGGLNFLTWDGCTEQNNKTTERMISIASQAATPSDYDPVEIKENKLLAANDMFQDEQRSRKSLQGNFSGLKPAEAKVSKKDKLGPAGNVPDISILKKPTIGPFSGSMSSPSASQGFGAEIGEGRSPASIAEGAESGEIEKEGSRFNDLFGYMGSEATRRHNPDFEGEFNRFNEGYRPSPNSQEGEFTAVACDDECAKEIIQASSADSDMNELAQKAGIENFGNSNEDIKNAFESVVDEKLSSGDLEKLREENESLRTQMSQIREKLESAPVQVLDDKGEDVSSRVSRPASSHEVVFNPRNHFENEFRSRGYYEDRRDQFSPDFSSGQNPKKVSLGSYSDQRRATASTTELDQVKNYNADIDRTFLQANSSSPVDDTFVRDYVEHLDRNSGSLEHLVVFENGRPSKIRVPDPRNPGAFVEHPLQGEVANLIFEKVKQDEMESYAVYNMLSFGLSLQEFMEGLESENSNLTTLSGLNRHIETMRTLE